MIKRNLQIGIKSGFYVSYSPGRINTERRFNTLTRVAKVTFGSRKISRSILIFEECWSIHIKKLRCSGNKLDPALFNRPNVNA